MEEEKTEAPKKKWVVILRTGACKELVVEASSELEAKELAEASEENYFSLCHHCNDEMELDNFSGEAVSAFLEDEE